MNCSPLKNVWSLFYHLPQDKNWENSSYVNIFEEINSVEKLTAINEYIPEDIVKYCMLFVMREGISPIWEDILNRHGGSLLNRNGGCFSYKVTNKMVPMVWKQLFNLLCTENLTVNKSHMQNINGITISPKRNFCIIKIWTADCVLQDPSTIVHIEQMVKMGCLFRKHEPEF